MRQLRLMAKCRRRSLPRDLCCILDGQWNLSQQPGRIFIVAKIPILIRVSPRSISESSSLQNDYNFHQMNCSYFLETSSYPEKISVLRHLAFRGSMMLIEGLRWLIGCAELAVPKIFPRDWVNGRLQERNKSSINFLQLWGWTSKLLNLSSGEKVIVKLDKWCTSVTDSKDSFQKFDPHTGSVLGSVQNSSRADVDAAVSCAQEAFRDWADRVASERASILRVVTTLMSENLNEFSKIIAKETGKPPHDAKSELAGAIALGEFFAGEGARLYGTSLRSTACGKRITVREPYGGLLDCSCEYSNPNLAWKVSCVSLWKYSRRKLRGCSSYCQFLFRCLRKLLCLPASWTIHVAS